MSKHHTFCLSMEMSRLTRDGTAEPVSRDQIFRREREQGNVHFPCSAGYDQDWQPHPVDPYSAICDGHTSIMTVFPVAKVMLCLEHHVLSRKVNTAVVTQAL